MPVRQGRLLERNPAWKTDDIGHVREFGVERRTREHRDLAVDSTMAPPARCPLATIGWVPHRPRSPTGRPESCRWDRRSPTAPAKTSPMVLVSIANRACSTAGKQRVRSVLEHNAPGLGGRVHLGGIGSVQRPSDLHDDPQLKHRGFFVTLKHPVMGCERNRRGTGARCPGLTP